jgi:hypothetical protein
MVGNDDYRLIVAIFRVLSRTVEQVCHAGSAWCGMRPAFPQGEGATLDRPLPRFSNSQQPRPIG